VDLLTDRNFCMPNYPYTYPYTYLPQIVGA